MPLPTRRDGESRDDFLSRCMDDDTMKQEYPDEDQRYAVCQRQVENSRAGGCPILSGVLAIVPAEWRATTTNYVAALAGGMPPVARLPQIPRVSGRVGVLPIHGLLTARRMDGIFSLLFGGTDMEMLGQQLDTMVADKSVGGIVLDIDSPGGEVQGVPEMGERIRAARETKPIIAVANHQASSAGYWLASQATQVVATPSAKVGSIGVIAIHLDDTDAMAVNGIKQTIISAGEYKDEWWGPPTKEAIDAGQEQVDAYYSMFVSAVAKGRGIGTAGVQDKYGQGREVMAGPALETGMVDRIATLDEVIAGMAGNKPARRSRAEAQKQRLRMFDD